MNSPIRGRRDAAATWRERTRIIGIAVVVILILALVLSNLDEATVDWIVGDTTAPLALVLIVVFALGTAFGWLTNRRSGKYSHR